MTVLGIVEKGFVVPNSPLPDGAHVEIRVLESPPEISAELQEEFDAWERAGAGTVEMVERLAEEMEANEKR